MVRAISVAVAVFLALFIVGAGVIYLTASEGVINPAKIAQAQGAPAAPGAAGQMLGAGAALLGVAPPSSSSPSNAQVAVAIDRLISEAKRSLALWYGLTMLGGLAASLTWLVLAARRGRSVAGSQGQRSGRGAWLMCAVAVVGLAGAAAFYVTRTHALAGLIAGGVMTVQMVACFAAALIGYYLATAFGVSSVMLPSVPGASVLRR